MRAVVCRELGAIEDLSLETVDDPEPQRGEVLIDVIAAGLNFPDLLVLRGQYQARPALPFTPGGECAGVVAALGEGVERVALGEPVVATGLTGAFAEKVVVGEKAVLPIPEGMGFETAAGFSVTYATSYYALKRKARLAAGETLLVLGAGGGGGTAAVAIGKALGATVIAAASSAEKLDAATEAGADLRLDYSTEPLKERVKELTGGRGADVIYDPVGGAYSEPALRAIAIDGRYLVVGFAAGEIPKIPLNLALLKSAEILGVFWGSWAERDPVASNASFLELKQMFEDGRLAPRVTTYPFEDFKEALAALAERRARGKLVLVMAGA